jgi:hypothetical protein
LAHRAFSFVAGVFYVALGVAGFIPALCREIWNPVIARQFGVDPGTPLLFGCIPVSTAINLLHIAAGGTGVAMALSPAGARLYSRGLALLTLGLSLVAVLPNPLNSVWNLLPCAGGQMAIHLLTAPTAFYFGWVYLFRYDDGPTPFMQPQPAGR